MFLKEPFGDSDGPVDQRRIPADVAPLFLALKPLVKIDVILHLPEIPEEQGVFNPQPVLCRKHIEILSISRARDWRLTHGIGVVSFVRTSQLCIALQAKGIDSGRPVRRRWLRGGCCGGPDRAGPGSGGFRRGV